MTTEFENALRSGSATVVWLLHIHFDAFFDEIPAKDFYFSSSENVDFVVEGAEITFKGRVMKDIPKGRHQRDRGQDICNFSLINPGNATYRDFKAYEPIMERGEVTVYQCLELEEGYYEGLVRFVGYLKDFTVADSDKTLRFSAVSDMSRAGYPVGALILTRERCRAEFNYGGVHPANAYRLCTWQTIQGGNPDYCSHYKSGVDSCMSHGNTHQFAAIEDLVGATISFVLPSEVDFPYENQGCFTENVFICDKNWNISPISFAKIGQTVKAFDIMAGEIVDAKVLEVLEHVVDSFSIVEFGCGGFLETTANHLFRVKGNKFAPVGSMEGKRVMGRDKHKNAAEIHLKRIAGISRRQTVYNLHTTANTFIVTNAEANTFFDVHNRKPNTPIEI